MTLREFAQREAPPWARWLVLLLLMVAVGAAGFSAGRFAGAESIDERVSVVTITREKTVERWHKAKDRIVYVEKITSPDGTITEKRSEKETERAELARDVERRSDERAESAKVTTARPDWRVSAQVGAQFSGKPALELAGPMVLGAQVERRIIGGVSAGLWGSTAGAGGVAVSVEF